MNTTIMTCDAFIAKLVTDIPGFKAIYDEHMRDYAEVLPYVLVGDLTRYVITAYRQSSQEGSGDASTIVSRTLDLLELTMASSDPRMQELISVSFLENLPQADEDYAGIKALLGPHLEKELACKEKDAGLLESLEE